METANLSDVGKHIKLADSMACKLADYEVVAGRVSVRAAAEYLKKPDQPFIIFIAERVYADAEKKGAPLIESGISLTEENLSVYEDHRIKELDVVLFPEGVFFSREILERAYEELEKKRSEEKQTAQERAEKIRRNVLEVYKRLKELYDSMRGRRVEGDARFDKHVVETVKILNGEIGSLQKSVYEAVEDLLNGEGRIIACLNGVSPPDDEEAALALKIAVGSMLAGFHLSRLRADIAMETSDLADLFLEGLLANSGMWGSRPEKGHEERSAGIITLLREQGCKIPNGLEDVVLAHSKKDLTRKYVFSISVNFESTHTDEFEMILGKTIYVQRDVLVSQEEVLAEHKGLIDFIIGLFPLANAGVKEPKIKVTLLDDMLLAKIIIVSLVEELCFGDKAGIHRHIILGRISERIPAPPGENYDLARDFGTSQTIYVFVVSAIANAFDIMFKGALVEFNDDTVMRRSTRRQTGLDGCIGVVIDAKCEFGPVVYVFMHKKNGGRWLRPPPIGRNVADLVNMRMSGDGSLFQLFVPLGHRIMANVFRGNRRRVVGSVDPATFEARFGHLQSVIPRLCVFLKTQER
jgi:hypothetical protein